MKYLKIAMICSVVNFVANDRGNKIAILLLLAAILFSPNESEAMTSQKMKKMAKMAEEDSRETANDSDSLLELETSVFV